MSLAKAWKAKAKWYYRLWARADKLDRPCICEDGKIQVGSSARWHWQDCPFCKLEREVKRLRAELESLKRPDPKL